MMLYNTLELKWRSGSLGAAALLSMVLLTGLKTGPAAADNLFPVKKAAKITGGSSAADPSSIYSDLRARNVGDILTIVITENTQASSTATTKTSNDDTVNVNAGSGLFKKLFNYLTASASNTRANNGSGTTSRSGSLSTTLSVLVKEIQPNGVLKVEGNRLVGINKEVQRVSFSGLVRPEDVSIDNTIASNLVADAQVLYEGKGIVSETQRLGILSRIARFLF